MRSDDVHRTCHVLHPNARFRSRWDIAQVVALVYVAFFVPARTGFSIDLEVFSWEWWIELLVDVYFICDIVVNCMISTPSHAARPPCSTDHLSLRLCSSYRPF